MFFSVALVALAAVSSHFIAAGADESVQDTIMARQAPGTPRYECHSNCGNALSGRRITNHCDNSTWVGYYEACLDCAFEFDIWSIYGNGLAPLGEACGLPTEGSAGGTTSSSSSTTPTSAFPTAAPPPSPATSSGTTGNSTITPTPSASPVPGGAAALQGAGHIVMGAGALAIFAALVL